MEKAIIIALIGLSFLASIVAILLVWVITSRQRKKKANDNVTRSQIILPKEESKENKENKENKELGVNPTTKDDASSCECNCCGALNSLISRMGTGQDQSTLPSTPITIVPTSTMPQSTIPTNTTQITTMPTNTMPQTTIIPTTTPEIMDSKTTATIVSSTNGAHQYMSNLQDKLVGAAPKPLLDVRKLMASNSGEYNIYQRRGTQTKAMALRDTAKVVGPAADPTKSILEQPK